ncbi:glycosyltransferase family 4 protein [Psychromonas ossibalaenae]|uniref:glycosyltransferase family 4 protein n=1 Tax=Psychromonas ossibalaenae TaxID=444922 RepID=UPI0003767BEB|nr:glycosyltransferase family 4 protein [Psychromonas ossibalaenae]
MKKILFIVNVDWFFVSHRLPIALKAMEEGYDVHLACSFTDKRQELIRYGIHTHEINFSRSGNGLFNELGTLINVRKLVKSIKPDLVHSITIKPVIYSGMVIRSLINKPAFVAAISGLGYVFSANNLRAKLTKLLVSFLYRFALSHQNKTIIFQNNSDESILTDVANLNVSQKVLIRGSGADLERYSFHEEPDDSTIKVVMACRLLKEKGVYEFVGAAKLLHKQEKNVEFVLIGSPDPENPNSVSVAEVESWHKAGVINALGHRNDVHQIFADSHIVTLPSYYGEGVPKVLIEAAACGRPVVTTDNPGCRDAVIPLRTGMLVPIKNSEALAEVIQKLVEDKELRINMGSRAREFAEQEFDIKSVVNKHMDIYLSLLRGKFEPL